MIGQKLWAVVVARKCVLGPSCMPRVIIIFAWEGFEKGREFQKSAQEINFLSNNICPAVVQLEVSSHQNIFNYCLCRLANGRPSRFRPALGKYLQGVSE